MKNIFDWSINWSYVLASPVSNNVLIGHWGRDKLTIVCGVTIGEYAFIGAGAVVNKNVPDYALMVGVPAKQIGWMSEYGEKLDLPLTGDGQTICAITGVRYSMINGFVSCLEE